MVGWKLKSNLEVLGYFDTAKIFKKNKVPFAIAYAAIFNRSPRII